MPTGSAQLQPHTDVICPVCGAAGQVKRPGAFGEWRLYRCRNCDVEHFWPAKNPGHEWYERNALYSARDADLVDWLAWYHRAAFALLPVTSGRLIDVGCGNGAFVAAAIRQGFDAVGIDFSVSAIESGRRLFGIDSLFSLAIDDAREVLGGPFDVVTAFETLEHMDEPARFLEQLTALTLPGGWVVVSVPNRGRRPFTSAHGDVPPHHFTRWSEHALRTAISGAGLRVHAVSISPPSVTLKIFLLELVRSGVVQRMIQSDVSRTGHAATLRRARRMILLKDRLATLAAAVLTGIAGPVVRGAMMVALAQRPPDARK